MVEILGAYYGRMTERIFAHGGTLKEYVGDELMAFFGAPLEQDDHAARACAAALEMGERRRALNAEWAAAGRPALRARTGINTGPMLVGNLGSTYRFAYGVLGDQVNLGSRLEGLNREYGTELLVGEGTALAAGPAFLFREVDLVRVKGKARTVRVHELLARAGDALPEGQRKALATYSAALAAYRLQRWGEALALFEEALGAWAEDGPSRTMARRCRAYLRAPPADEWDGAFDQGGTALRETG
jgi:adenylate cyclase